MQKNGLDAMMLWVYQNLWHLSGREPMISMTGEFKDFNSEIVARLAEHLIPFVQQAAAAETLVQDFERGLVLPITSRRRESDGHLSASVRGWRPR